MKFTHRRAMLLAAIALLVLVTCTGCGGRGGDSAAAEWQVTVTPDARAPATITHGDGTRLSLPPGSSAAGSSARARQPDRPTARATARAQRDAAGAVDAGAQTPGADNPSAVLADMWWLQALGVLLILSGGALWLLRWHGLAQPWARVITSNVPKGSGVLLITVGGGLLVLPYYLEQYGWMLPIAAAAAVAWIAWRWWAKYRQRAEQSFDRLRTSPEPVEGQPDEEVPAP